MDECKACANADNEYCFACDNGNHFKPMTNYDQIINKTPEELADWIELLLCPANCPDEQMGEACARTSCDGCWLSWLKSPAEDKT